MAGYDYTNPQASLNYLLNPGTPLPETDFNAASAAVGGGMIGSGFAGQNRLRLRDSERIQRLALGQQLLQPYLARASAEGMQANQIAANAASQAISEAGLTTRLSAEGQQRLQLALLSGNQQAAHDLLSEAGLDRRTAATLAGHLQDTILTNQQRSFEAILPYAQRRYEDRRSQIYGTPSNPRPMTTAGAPDLGGGGGAPGRAPARSTSSADQSAVDRILAGYGIGTGGGGGGGVAGFNAGWQLPQPAGNPDVANYFTPQGEFDWQRTTSPDMVEAQNYYE